jgi:two-component system cell cycle sensor histidine kinase/response regulator CckA
MNLALNAAEAMENRAGEVSIATSIETESANTHVALKVEDTGCGMDETTRARIFDPFFTTKFMGRGLGLAAAMGIIRANRGEIIVESAPGRGSKFRVLFPVAQSSAGVAQTHYTPIACAPESQSEARP